MPKAFIYFIFFIIFSLVIGGNFWYLKEHKSLLSSQNSSVEFLGANNIRNPSQALNGGEYTQEIGTQTVPKTLALNQQPSLAQANAANQYQNNSQVHPGDPLIKGGVKILGGSAGGGGGGATPTFVQENDNLVFSGSSVSVTLNGIAAHNALAVGVYWNNTGVTLNSITDDCSEPQSYSIIDTADDGGTAYGATAYNYNVTGGNCTITANFSGAIAEAKIWAHEVSGVSTSNPLDGHTVILNDYNNTTCTDCITSGSIVTTQNNDYIFGFQFNTASAPIDAGTSFTDPDPTDDSRGTSEYKIQSTAGSIAATFSKTDTTGSAFVGFITSLKSAGGNAGGGVKFR